MSAGGPDASVTVLGVKLESRNLIHDDGLQNQLMQILQVLADFSLQFKEVDKRLEAQGVQFRELSAQLKTAKGEIERIDSKVDDVERAVRADLREVDNRHRENFVQDRKRLDALETATSALEEDVKSIKLRTHQLEEDSVATQATVASHGERLSTAEGLLEDARTRVKVIEDTLEEVDLMGIKDKLEDHEKRCTELEEEHRKLAMFLDKTKKKTVWIEETLVPEVREQAKTDRAKIRREIDEHVSKLMDLIRLRVTRQEYDDEQNYFHSQLTQWVVEEMDTSRRRMLEKVTRLQTRMAQELEDLTKVAEVEECVAKMQEISSAVGEISESLYEHKGAIDRNAEKLMELGASSAQVSELRQGFEELKAATQVALSSIKNKIRNKMSETGEGSAKTQALGALESQISSSLETIKTQLANEFAPKMTFEETISVLKKRIVDLEWKMMKRKADDSGLEGVDMYRQFNERLAMMHHPILLAHKHPASDKLPARPRSALPSGRTAQTTQTPGKQRPGSAQFRVVEEEAAVEPGLPSVAVTYFESSEMRQAYREGRNVATKGSAAAMRIFRPKSAGGDQSLEIPSSLQALLSEPDDTDTTWPSIPLFDESLPQYPYQDSLSGEQVFMPEYTQGPVQRPAIRPASAHVESKNYQQPQRINTASHSHAFNLPSQSRNLRPASRPESAPLQRNVLPARSPSPNYVLSVESTLGDTPSHQANVGEGVVEHLMGGGKIHRTLHPLPESTQASES